MSGLSAPKAAALVQIVRSLPDARLRTLREALASQAAGGWADPVRQAAETETANRRLRDAVFCEFVALSGPTAAPPLHPVAPFAASLLWTALKVVAAEEIAAAAIALAERESEVFDAISLALVQTAAAGLQSGRSPFDAIPPRLAASPGGVERVTRLLRLLPISRRALPRAAGWLKRVGPEDVSGLKLALRDASALCEDGGPLLIQLLTSAFPDPWTALRLSSAVMDRPSEAFMAASELSAYAEAIFDQVDRALLAVRDFDGGRGREAGAAAAASTERAIEGLHELEHCVQLDRDQAWGRRAAAQKRALALAAELRLKEAEGALVKALPLKSNRPGGRGPRGLPAIDRALDALDVNRAEALLTYVDETRRAASKGGFGGVRTQVVEALDARLSTYVDDLLDMLRAPEPEWADALRERLEIAADLLGLVRDAGATQIVRRRMAAA